MRRLVLFLALMAGPALAQPPALKEGTFTYAFPSEYQETPVACPNGTYVLTWGAHSYILKAEGDYWAHPQRVTCREQGVRSGNIRFIGQAGQGFQQGRATAKRKALGDYFGSDAKRSFTWKNRRSPVSAATKTFMCSNAKDWAYIPPSS